MDIIPKLMKRIYACARECGMNNDLLHILVFRETGKTSIKQLSCTEAMKVVGALEGPPRSGTQRSGTEAEKIPERKGMITQKQYNMIVRLSYVLGWNGNIKRINGFVKKYTGIESVKWLTKYQAGNVIEGLKKLEERSEAAQK
ncbi:MAG: hypothetical protein BWY15_00445 [Firmicutes bacterium ADurb.Bin193]|nr:MAG: hypothetical protein BWY15_00445 [Firmicutes bacterium ADurb.Bin193]